MNVCCRCGCHTFPLSHKQKLDLKEFEDMFKIASSEKPVDLTDDKALTLRKNDGCDVVSGHPDPQESCSRSLLVRSPSLS